MSALGVTEVTGFLLSARNFSRTTTEIVAVVDELKKFFTEALHSLASFSRLNLRVATTGNLDLLPKDMQANMARIEAGSDDESRTKKLRFCAAYSSKLDLKNMVIDFANAVREGVIKSDDISPDLIAGWLAFNEASETELWFRSSGERRFSEFLVLQSGYAYMHREPKFWPSVIFWHWAWAILRFQLNWPHIKAVKDNHRTLWNSPCDQDDPAK
ncbi:hypothetical protein MTO96_034574, partial [Rhipicephalus appendiculatus]